MHLSALLTVCDSALKDEGVKASEIMINGITGSTEYYIVVNQFSVHVMSYEFEVFLQYLA